MLPTMSYTVPLNDQVARDCAIKDFEDLIAEFYGAPYAIAVDSCTHAMELCMRYEKYDTVKVPTHTYLSVPLIMKKVGGIDWKWEDNEWKDYYYIKGTNIVDAAVHWKRDSYIADTYFCLSFQARKHLPLGRGGMILTDNPTSHYYLKEMSCDGRDFYRPWRDQDIDVMGYHYYMTPEKAAEGIDKFQDALVKPTKQWSYMDYPYLPGMSVFKHDKF